MKQSTGRAFVVGDIHGCAAELERLLRRLELEPSDRIIFLGDYIDRGADAKAVVDLLLDLKTNRRCQSTFLKGNHEDMFLDFLGFGGLHGDAFLLNGGMETLRSYGFEDPASLSGEDEILPANHRDFFLELGLTFELDSVLCVHAGINPKRGMNSQITEDLLWIREAFYTVPHLLERTVIFGHTPQREVYFDLPYKIGIDTGLVYGGKLSCLEITERRLFQIGLGAETVSVSGISAFWLPDTHAF